jgi:hypothetical protein
VLDPRDAVADLGEVFVGEHDAPPGLQSLVGLAHRAAGQPEAVHRVVAELVLHAVLQAGAGAQQDDQHEDAPGDGEAGEQRAQLVAPQHVEDLLPLVEVEDPHALPPTRMDRRRFEEGRGPAADHGAP